MLLVVVIVVVVVVAVVVVVLLLSVLDLVCLSVTVFLSFQTINLVFRKDFHDFTPGVLDAKDDNWRKTRHILTPTFSAHKMKLVS